MQTPTGLDRSKSAWLRFFRTVHRISRYVINFSNQHHRNSRSNSNNRNLEPPQPNRQPPLTTTATMASIALELEGTMMTPTWFLFTK